MTKQEVISRLCALASEVSSQLNPLFAHDCFCGENELSGDEEFGGFQFHHQVVEFIESAVRINLRELMNQLEERPGHPRKETR